MRLLAFAAVVIVGCSTGTAMRSGPNPRLARLEQESQKIDQGEKRCVYETVIWSNRQIAQIAVTPDAFTDLEMETVTSERDRGLFECKANADRERDELSSRERAEYQTLAPEERARTALMMTLTTSSPR